MHPLPIIYAAAQYLAAVSGVSTPGEPEPAARDSDRTPSEVPPSGERPADSTDGFLQALGLAVRQLHLYSPSHPVFLEAIGACQKALVAHSGADELAVRVTAGTLQVDDRDVSAGTPGEQLLLTRLQRARVVEFTISRDATAWELSQFVGALLVSVGAGITVSERLTEHGISTISARVVPRPEVLDVQPPSGAEREILTRERQRREALLSTGAKPGYMYPADRGWVRVDPAVDHRAFSLTDLSILVDDPAELAGMLSRLGEDHDTPGAEHRSALERRFRDVARLFASLDSRPARMMFARLARVVLEMEPVGRERLLRETVLPGLLDGGAEGEVLQDFPDPTLAESLCVLLDLETAAPDIVTTALDRLDISADRRAAVEPLIEVQMRNRGTDMRAPGRELDAYARRLTRMTGAPGVSFTDFAAFDLSFDAQTAEQVVALQAAIRAADALAVSLDCLTNLVAIEPNPEIVGIYLQSVLTGFAELHRTSQWTDLASRATRLRELAGTLRERRPDVAAAIAAALVAFCTRDVAHAVMSRHLSDAADRRESTEVLDAFADSLAPAFATLLLEPLPPPVMYGLIGLLSERAATFAPELVARLAMGCSADTARAIVKILAHAGAGNETAIAGLLSAADEPLAGEAFRALARIGTPEAAGHVIRQLSDRRGWIGAAALQALLHFPPAVTGEHARGILARKDLALRHPALVGELLERTARGGAEGMNDVLASLSRLRFRFWNPAVARLGRRARSLLPA